MEKNKDTGIIRRVKKERAFSQILNELINNKQLSYKALGILTYILSKPDDWEVYNSDLIREGIDGKESVRTGLLELKEKKYIQRYRVFNKKTGSVHHWETLVSETPFADDELISSVKETYAYDEEGKIIYKKVVLGNFERYVPIVINREVTLLSENQKVEKNYEKKPTIQKSKSRKPKTRKTDTTNTNNTNTNFSTNTESSSSSKGETPDSIHPLVELFNDSICELKKTTTIKFMKYVEKYDKEFIEAIIAYCEERNAKSFSYFQKTIDRYISEDITTVDALNSSIENFKDENKTKKNNALKAKDEARKEKEFEDTINENILEDMINDKNTAEEVHNKINAGENVNELKELLKKDMTDIQFKTWIAGLDFKLNANELFIVCPNSFTKDVLVKRYEYIIKNVVKQAELNVEIEYVVAE
jgi:hypothetical protein